MTDGGLGPLVLMRELFPQEPAWGGGTDTCSRLDESTVCERDRLPRGGTGWAGGRWDGRSE
ncbi:hypothetical protein [Streptomyces griseoruber]|uniref:hypothetical protein n=1 Tax=Streptomyces griseoruber TaxID=1943 RepID=UPI00131BECD5|nr:hypothetical protein [Streptomyces griseoruber]